MLHDGGVEQVGRGVQKPLIPRRLRLAFAAQEHTQFAQRLIADVIADAEQLRAVQRRSHGMAAGVEKPVLRHVAEHREVAQEPDLLLAANVHPPAAHREHHHHHIHHRLGDSGPVVQPAGHAAVARHGGDQLVEQRPGLAHALPALPVVALEGEEGQRAAGQAAQRVALRAAHPGHVVEAQERPGDAAVDLPFDALEQLRRHRVQPGSGHLRGQRQVGGGFGGGGVHPVAVGIGQGQALTAQGDGVVLRQEPAGFFADRPYHIGQLHVVAPVRRDAAAQYQVAQHGPAHAAVGLVIRGHAGPAEADEAGRGQRRHVLLKPRVRPAGQPLPHVGGQAVPSGALLGRHRHEKFIRALQLEEQRVQVLFQHAVPPSRFVASVDRHPGALLRRPGHEIHELLQPRALLQRGRGGFAAGHAVQEAVVAVHVAAFPADGVFRGQE